MPCVGAFKIDEDAACPEMPEERRLDAAERPTVGGEVDLESTIENETLRDEGWDPSPPPTLYRGPPERERVRCISAADASDKKGGDVVGETGDGSVFIT